MVELRTSTCTGPWDVPLCVTMLLMMTIVDISTIYIYVNLKSEKDTIFDDGAIIIALKTVYSKTSSGIDSMYNLYHPASIHNDKSDSILTFLRISSSTAASSVQIPKI
jgi:hypothetical protein